MRRMLTGLFLAGAMFACLAACYFTAARAIRGGELCPLFSACVVTNGPIANGRAGEDNLASRPPSGERR